MEVVLLIEKDMRRKRLIKRRRLDLDDVPAKVVPRLLWNVGEWAYVRIVVSQPPRERLRKLIMS